MDEGTDARDILENRVLPLRRGQKVLFYFTVVWIHCSWKVVLLKVTVIAGYAKIQVFYCSSGFWANKDISPKHQSELIARDHLAVLKHTLLSVGCIFLGLFILYFSSMKLSNVSSASQGYWRDMLYPSQIIVLFANDCSGWRKLVFKRAWCQWWLWWWWEAIVKLWFLCQGSKLKKSLSRLLATNWRIIVGRCKFLVASLYNVNDAAHSIS